MVVYTLLQCTQYQIYFRSVSKNRCLHVNLYCAIEYVLLFVCACELQQGYSTSILLDDHTLDHAQKSAQYIHHGLRNTFFKWYPRMIWYRLIHGTHCPTIQRDTAVPPLHWSCHSMRICRRHATAPKSAASSFVRLSRLISVQRDESPPDTWNTLPDHPT